MEATLGKRSGLRPILIVAAVLIVIGFIGFLVLQGQHGKALKAQHDRAAATASEMAIDLTRVLATTIADDAARLEHAMLDMQLATVVRGRHVAAVVVLNPSGEVLATTDQRWAGRTLDDAETMAAMAVNEATVMPAAPVPGQIEVAAPLFVGPDRLGTVRVFVDLGEFGPSSSSK